MRRRLRALLAPRIVRSVGTAEAMTLATRSTREQRRAAAARLQHFAATAPVVDGEPSAQRGES